jgi:hypothetical protein
MVRGAPCVRSDYPDPGRPSLNPRALGRRRLQSRAEKIGDVNKAYRAIGDTGRHAMSEITDRAEQTRSAHQ